VPVASRKELPPGRQLGSAAVINPKEYT